MNLYMVVARVGESAYAGLRDDMASIMYRKNFHHKLTKMKNVCNKDSVHHSGIFSFACSVTVKLSTLCLTILAERRREVFSINSLNVSRIRKNFTYKLYSACQTL